MEVKIVNCNELDIFLPLCWENTMLTYSKITNNNYVKAFVGSWGFNYDNNNDTIGECIRRDDYFSENLVKYCNTKMEIRRIDNIEIVIDKIVDNLTKDVPTMIHFDTFFAHWNGFYKKEHYRHVILVIGCDMDKKVIKIVDTDIRNKEFEVTFGELEKACEFYVEFTNISNEKECDILEQLSEKINNDTLIRQNMFSKIEEFARDFEWSFDPEKEFCNVKTIDDMLNSKFVSEFRSIMKGRVLFIYYLRNIEQKYNFDLSQVICPLSVALSKWNNIINLLVKNCFMNWKKNISLNITKILKLIADIEKNAYHNLIKIMISKTKNTNNKINDKKQECKSIAFDLRRYVNNKGFGFTKNDIDSDYTGTGEFIVLKNEYEKGIILEDKEVSFELCLNAKFDNVICEKQVIDIEMDGGAYGIAVLCSSEWGNNHEVIQCIDNEGKVEFAYITSYDIAKLDYENKIVIGPSYIKEEGICVRENNTLTYNIVMFEKQIKLKQIILPYCLNMHIFAMSLLV